MAQKVQSGDITLSLLQRRFADAYIRIGNVSPQRAAIEAGYSVKSAKREGERLLELSHVREYIDATLKSEADNAVMNRWQALRLLNDIAQGKVKDFQVVVVGTSVGHSEPRVVEKPVSIKDRKEALEVMLKFSEFDGAQEQIEASTLSTDDRLIRALNRRPQPTLMVPDGTQYEEDDDDGKK